MFLRLDALPTQLTVRGLWPALGGGKLVLQSFEFRVIGELGVGASARVLEVERASGERFALKVAREGYERTILAEARALALGQGPGLIRMFGVGVLGGGGIGLLLERVAGVALGSSEQRVAPETIWQEVGGALVRLHRLGVTHGDVKPENILVSGQRLTLIDLGLASLDTRPLGWTPRYAAPEVRAGEVGGPLADTYALARTLEEVFPEAALPFLAPYLEEKPERRLGIQVDSSALDLLRTAVTRIRLPYIEAGLRGIELGVDEIDFAFESGRVQAELAPTLQLLLGCVWAERELTHRDITSMDGGRDSVEERASVLAELLGPLRSEERARFFGFLAGPAALRFQFDGQDEELWQRILAIAERKPLAALTQDDLDGEPAFFVLPIDPIELSLFIGSEKMNDAALDALIRIPELPMRLCLEAARIARRRGRYAGAHQFLDRVRDPEFAGQQSFERALLLRRQGRTTEALALLAQSAGDPKADRVLAAAMEARVLYDRGEYDTARRLLGRANGSSMGREVLALLELAEGRPDKAIDGALAGLASVSDDEGRARLLSVLGMAHQFAGRSELARVEFQRAVDSAVRARAPLEEGTYLTGLAAVATDAGQFEEALGAAERAGALFEVLGQPTLAARALLARAAVLSILGRSSELEEVVVRARPLATSARDHRCLGYLELCVADGASDSGERLEAARRAFTFLEDPEDRLRAEARIFQFTGEAAVDAESRAERTELVDARLEWWRARALRAVEKGASDVERIIERVSELSSTTQSFAMGPAEVATAELALSLGQPDVARRLLESALRRAERLERGAPASLRQHARALPWVRQAMAQPTREFSDAQLADVESLLRALSHRDGLQVLLRQVLDLLLLWTRVDRGLLLLKAPGERLSVRVGRNLRRKDLSAEQIGLSETLARRALQEGRPISIVDGLSDLSDLYRSVHVLRLRSVLAVPLVAGGEMFGVAYLDDRAKSGAFGAGEIAWVQLIATIAALAIRDARDRLLLRREQGRTERAKRRLERALEGSEASVELLSRQLRDEGAQGPLSEFGLVYESRVMHELLSNVRRIGASDVPLFINGESGVGKELVARAIAQAGRRKGRAFIAENCAALPENLLESELFGHVRGAFTGASRDRAGLFELASGGTLFLDEVGEMTPGMQAKLLRVLQDGSVRRVGSERPIRVDVRIIAATHRDLEELVQKGRFREDLFYRLSVIPLRVPPLRERREDILPLARHFLKLHAPERVVRIAPGAARALVDFDWPGNVRQLENEMRRLLVFVDREISVADLSLPKVRSSGSEAPLTLKDQVDSLERSLVLAALDEHHGNRTRMAEALGLSRHGLQKMMKRLGIAESP